MSQPNKSILIIDDEIDLGEALRDLISLEFEQVDLAHDPKLALEMIQKNQYALILSDYKMPGLSGLELAMRMRSQGFLTTLIWMSGYCDKEMALNGLRLGVLDILEKPIDTDSLSRYIHRAYDIERRRSEIISENGNVEQARKMLGLLYASDKRLKTSLSTGHQ